MQTMRKPTARPKATWGLEIPRCPRCDEMCAVIRIEKKGAVIRCPNNHVLIRLNHSIPILGSGISRHAKRSDPSETL